MRQSFIKVFLPSLFVLGFGLILFSADTFGHWFPDYRGDMIGVPMSSSGAIPSGVLFCEPPVDDTAPMICYFQGADAWSQAAVNQTGGDVEICAGIGTRQVTIDDFNNCAGDIVGVDINGAGVLNFTEGAQWNRGASNNDSCTSLAAAMNTAYGPSNALVASCPGGGAVLYMDLNPLLCTVDLTESDATCTTLTEGAQGDTTISEPIYIISGVSGALEWTLNGATISGANNRDLSLLGTAAFVQWSGNSKINGAAVNGNIVLYNWANNDFGLLQFGGTTNAFPALKRNGVGFQIRLADDSGYTNIRAQEFGANTTGMHHWITRSEMYSDADGNIRMTNDAGNSFGLLQFGGTTNAFPALKRSGTNLHARLADDSAYTVFEATSYLSGVAGYGFIGDPDTAITYDGADIIGIDVGGNEVLELDGNAGGDVNISPVRNLTISEGSSIVGLGIKTGLPDNVATGFVRFSVANNSHAGGSIHYGVHADDGVDFMALNGMVTWSAVNIAGAESCDVQEAAVSQSEISPGGGDSIAVTFTCASNAADTIDILVTSNYAGIVATSHEIHYTPITNQSVTVTGL